MARMQQWEVWYADFPYEEKDGSCDRPVIVLNIEGLQPIVLLSVKVTKHEVRDNDKYDTPINKWKEAGLAQPSVARISKTIQLTEDKFRRKIGNLQPEDILTISARYIDFVLESGAIIPSAVNE